MESNEEIKSIQIKRSNILKFGILDDDGKPTGQYLSFDLEDIEMPLRLNEANERHKKNGRWFKTALDLVERKPDYKGKKLLSSHQEEKLKLFNELYKKEIEAFNYAFGEGTAEKMLNGKRPYLNMFDDFSKALEPILPKIKNGYDDLKSNIVKKYSQKEDDVIE